MESASYKLKPMYRYLMMLTIASAIGNQGWQTLFNNFAVDVGHLNGNQIGIIQGVREIPGLLALLAIFLIRFLREDRLSALSILVLGGGLAATGFFPGYSGILITTLLMSTGFHYYETTNQSLMLQYFNAQTAPKVIGNFRGLAAASNIFIGLLILSLSYFFAYRELYITVGIIVTFFAVWAFSKDPTEKHQQVQTKKLVIRKRYWLYYFLTFMSGARRQIFTAFAVFLLVKKFKYGVDEIAMLFVINNIINYFLSPAIGRAIAFFGERQILSIEYSAVFFIFLAYAYVSTKWMAGVLYILDYIFFNFAIAINTYFQKIGDPREIASGIAVGFSINHIAAVVIPVIGGALWMIDYKIPFFAAAGLSIVSLLAVQKIHYVLPVKI
ncbi:MAG: MFS transporter [Calditrichaceae bacterium]|nr:MFS transporter [Calditrichaceae bacterium]MBN2710706.1 MFS transporter [Calditrichaceae bacterium]RQV92735.1 MAG: MFS transporter [Calditrichota bacterium]